MFERAILKAQHFTRPVVISTCRENGETSSMIGAYIILNEDGWILTANHLLQKIVELHKSTAEKPKEANPVVAFSTWWGVDGWEIKTFHYRQEADIAVGKIIGFEKSQSPGFCEFNNPSDSFVVGTSLCRLGFPLHGITPLYDSQKGFSFLEEALPIPFFPIDGIYTRTIVNKDKPSVKFIETSSPGLRSHSGGPIFDAKGRVWAMQSYTIHHPLGFSPPAPNKQDVIEHQFLNCGVGVHVETITAFLTQNKIEFNL